jgi:hypothetical protein
VPITDAVGCACGTGGSDCVGLDSVLEELAAQGIGSLNATALAAAIGNAATFGRG